MRHHCHACSPVSSSAVVFRVYDVNDDGFVDAKDLATVRPCTLEARGMTCVQVLRQLVGENLTEGQLQQIAEQTIKEADADKDGKIGFSEFQRVRRVTHITHITLITSSHTSRRSSSTRTWTPSSSSTSTCGSTSLTIPLLLPSAIKVPDPHFAPPVVLCLWCVCKVSAVCCDVCVYALA